MDLKILAASYGSKISLILFLSNTAQTKKLLFFNFLFLYLYLSNKSDLGRVSLLIVPLTGYPNEKIVKCLFEKQQLLSG